MTQSQNSPCCRTSSRRISAIPRAASSTPWSAVEPIRSTGALEYMNNRNLNAANNLDAVDGNPLHPRYDDNRFGGQAGGPIKKNKLFYFFNYEYEPTGYAG